jgi:ankyrin repeat protein
VLLTLVKLTKGSAALDEAYGEAIKRIDGQLAEDRSLARRALSWISYAQRLLTTKELCHALAIEPGDRALNNDNIYDVEDVISVCAGLVTVDEESSIIRLVHYTTQEYFERVRLEWNPGALEEIVVACLTYLSFDTFRSGSCANDEAFEQRLTENAFFNYSAHYWSEHVRPVESSTSRLALAFLCDEALVECTAQGALTPDYRYIGHSRSFLTRISGLHLTARYGLPYLTERLLMGKHADSNITADSKDKDGRTPLSLVAERGHEAVVRLLVNQYDVEPDSKNEGGQTPLSLAAIYSHDIVVQLLLATGKVNPEAEDTEYGQTPLSWAAVSGHTAVLKLLLTIDGVDADSKSSNSSDKGRSPLSYAAERGHDTIIKLLLATRRVDPDSKDSEGRTPLSYAVSETQTETVKLLLRHGASPSTINIKWKGILHHAIPNANCKLETMETLLALGAPNDTTNIDNMKLLHYTIRFARQDIAELFLRYGVPVDTAIQRKTWDLKRYENRNAYEPRDGNGSSVTGQHYSKGLTPLHYAALAGHSGMVQFFLDHGADPNALSNYDETLLHLALSRSPRGTKYSDYWMENDWRVEGLLNIIDLEDDDVYKAAHNQVVEHRIATINALLSHQKTYVNI